MNATKYEATYAIAQSAMSATEEVEKIVAKLKATGRPMTCKELGELIYGEEYKRTPVGSYRKLGFSEYCRLQRLNDTARRHTARLNQVLQHLTKAGFVAVGEIQSEPYTYETEEAVWVDDKGEAEFIDVWDTNGNQYQMQNPRHNRAIGIEYRKVVRTSHKKIRTYTWVEA